MLIAEIVNLGKWILRYLFANLIDEMIKQDEVYRRELFEKHQKTSRVNHPGSIQIPASTMGSWPDGAPTLTPRANGVPYPMTPGMSIGIASPAATHLPGVPEGAALDKKTSQTSRASGDKSGDYFSSTPISADPSTKAPPAAPAEPPSDDKATKPSSEPDKENNGKVFGKKFRMGMSFGTKKLGRSASSNTEKPVVVDEKVDDGSETSESGDKEKEFEETFLGIVEKIRYGYEKALLEKPDRMPESEITPSLPNETPVLKPPPMTMVIIQEETSGGSADLYRGTVATVGEDASLIERGAPMWLGDLLLKVYSHSPAASDMY